MIKINPLPREDIPAQRHIKLPNLGNLAPVALLVVVLVGLTVVYVYQNRQIANLEAIIAEEEQESRRLAPEIAKIKRLNQQRDDLNKRLDAISTLDRDRYFRVHLLDELNRSLPEHTWLTKFEDVGGDRYAIEGVTFTNFQVSDLLQNLDRSPYFTAVNLFVAERGDINDVKVVKFKVQTTAVRQMMAAPTGS